MLLSRLIFYSPNNGRKPESKPQLISLGRSPHKGGINCLFLGDSGSSSCKVFSGGFDKSVVLWSIKQERSSFKSKVKTLPIKHKAYISALACRGETLLSASGKNVRLSDICSNSSEAEVASAQFGTKVNQIHLHPIEHDIVILEVRLSSGGRNTRTPIETLRKILGCRLGRSNTSLRSAYWSARATTDAVRTP